jgi:hypothetical protein
VTEPADRSADLVDSEVQDSACDDSRLSSLSPHAEITSVERTQLF